MNEPIEHEYFNWLCAKVLDNSFGHSLMVILYETEFVWMIGADSNRAQDGLELKQDFLRETHTESDPLWEEEPCSVLEFLIAFAKRAQFQTDIALKDWFWIFLTNLGLDELRSQVSVDEDLARSVIFAFLHRDYDSRGFGGLFPMSRTKNDQRKLELWYQFCEWIDEQGLI